jgi:hypothetical protein
MGLEKNGDVIRFLKKVFITWTYYGNNASLKVNGFDFCNCFNKLLLSMLIFFCVKIGLKSYNYFT